MVRYLVKKILETLLTLFIVTRAVFFFVRMIPGDPARVIAGEQATLEDVENVRESLGLNKPVTEQYVIYVSGLLKGDLGTSLRTKRPVTFELKNRYPNTSSWLRWRSCGARRWEFCLVYGRQGTGRNGRTTWA